ncbi:hypothetical protein R1flu_025980 [Riccia fluitans]|uniref:Homeobox domain-containing protein n=1 Tax=Riccia fluitans TaxID=41844 RepID=A0ABD1XEN6_9MARC
MEGVAEVQGQGFDSSMAVTSKMGPESILHPRIEFSRDLRMELSADILTSIGGSFSEDVRPHGHLDMTSMREDMHLIPEIPFIPHRNAPSFSEHVNYTSVSVSPHSEMDSGVYSHVSEAQYSCPAPLEVTVPSTITELQRRPQDDPVIDESTNEYGFRNSSGAYIEAPVNTVAFAASLSSAVTSVDVGKPERIGSTQCEAYPVSMGASGEPSGVSVPSYPVPFDSQGTVSAATSFPKSDTTAGGDEFNTIVEGEKSTTAPTIPASSDANMTTDDKSEKEPTPSYLGKGPGNAGISSEGQICPQSKERATFSFNLPLGYPTATDGSKRHSSSPMRKSYGALLEETPASYNTSRALQEASDDRLINSDGEQPVRALTHFQIGNPVSGGAEFADLKAEPSEQLFFPAENIPSEQASTPTEHSVAASVYETFKVEPGEGLHDVHAPGFAHAPVEDHAVTFGGISDVISGPELPSSRDDVAPPLVESENDVESACLDTSQQAISLHSSAELSQVDRQPDLTGPSSLSADLSSPSECVLQSAGGAAEFSSQWPGTTEISASKLYAASRSEAISSSAEALPWEPDIVLQTSQPGQFWDIVSSSSRFIPSLSSVSSDFDRSRSPFRGRKAARRKRQSDSVIDREKTWVEIDKQEDVVALEIMIDAQKKAMLGQIDELQRIATVQCELTGKNPLSEEMVYEVFGGDGTEKKSSEQPSAEAQSYMREVFAIKDTITKKEVQEISGMCGASVRQVRGFFTARRIYVKKLVQQVFDETGRVAIKNATDQSSSPAHPSNNIRIESHLGIRKLTSVESMERYLELMRAERTFYGQIRLTQIILRTDPSSAIFRRFLEKGGLKVLHQWLVEAAAEEQTSLLRELLKALAHLPISSSAPHHLPALVQIVNKLRFYHNLDVSEQARMLLAHWSKMLKKKFGGGKQSGSAGTKPASVIEKGFGIAADGHKGNRDALPVTPLGSSLRKRKTKEGKEEESSQPDSKASGLSALSSPRVTVSALQMSPTAGHPPAPAPQPTKQRWSTTLQPSESAVAAVSVSRKRAVSKSLGDHAKERRKVQVVDDTAGKTLPSGVVSKSAAVNSSRPISTDDIYKAKRLQRLLQEPLKKSRKKLSEAQDIDPQTATTKELPCLQQPEVSRSSHDNILSMNNSPRNKQTLSSVLTAERSELSQFASLSAEPEEGSDRPSIIPTSSPDRAARIIIPASSYGRPELITTRTLSPDRPQLNITRTSSAYCQVGVVKPTSPQAPPQSFTTPLSSEVKPQEVVATPSSVSSQDRLQSATVVDSNHRNIFRLSSLLTSGLTADDRQAILPYSSNIGLIESVIRADSPQQLAADSIGPDLTSVFTEHNEALGEGGKPSKKNVSTDRELQHQVGEAQVFSVFHPTPPVEPEVSAEKQVVDNSAGSCSRELPMIDFYAALRSNMIRWRIPPVYHLDPQWKVAAGEESKEKDVQSARVKREEEAYYLDFSSIPSDPKDPWEEEPNYDDTLTFEIYLDNGQRKPPSGTQIQADQMTGINMMASGAPPTSFTTETSSTMFDSQDIPDPCPSASGLDSLLQQLSPSGGIAHDPALLSLLLQNPDLVSQLTSGQNYAQTGVANQKVLTTSVVIPKQPSSVANSGFRMQAGDTGMNRFGAANVGGAGALSLQPVHAAPSMTQLPPEGMRLENPSKHPHDGIGHHQNPGLVSQAGSDAQYPAPLQMRLAVGNTAGWGQARMAPPLPPPPPLPSILSGGNQVLQPSMQPQTSKVTNWPESQPWNNVGAVGRPPSNVAEIHSGQEQLHMRPQTIISPNVRSPNYGLIGLPQVEANPVVSQHEMHNASKRQWSNGSHFVIAPSVSENTVIQVGQDSVIGRISRWPTNSNRPPPTPDSQLRPVAREYSDFQGSRQANVTENGGVWVPNDQDTFRPPPPPPYAVPHQWNQRAERNIWPGPQSGVYPLSHGRDSRPPHHQPLPQSWHRGMGPPRPFGEDRSSVDR